MVYPIPLGQNKVTEADRLLIKRRAYTSVFIPDSITRIGNGAFYGCESLTSIDIPPAVTSIGSTAFAGCTQLTEMIIPVGITSIGRSAFSGCANLKKVDFIGPIDELSASCFEYCNELTTVTFRSPLTAIGDSAFRDCKSLRSVAFPGTLSRIGTKVFQNCSMDLTTIYPAIFLAIDERVISENRPEARTNFLIEYINIIPEDPRADLPNLSNYLKNLFFSDPEECFRTPEHTKIFLKFCRAFVNSENLDALLEIANVRNATNASMQLLDISSRLPNRDLSDLSL